MQRHTDHECARFCMFCEKPLPAFFLSHFLTFSSHFSMRPPHTAYDAEEWLLKTFEPAAHKTKRHAS
jgi:hypothetical protein